MLRICILVFTLRLIACGSGQREEPGDQSAQTDQVEFSSSNSLEDEQGYADGEYCASVDYYNPNTGTSSTYDLTVEVQDNELMVIHWPNGGWLDHSHFCCAEFDDNGYTSFTSDRGYDYDVTLTGEGGCDFGSAVNPEDEEDAYIEDDSEYEQDDQVEEDYQDEDYEDQ